MQDEWTDEQFERIISRLAAFNKNPETLRPDVLEKCKEFKYEVEKDSQQIEDLISKGIDVRTISEENPKRVAVVEWLAKTP